MKYPEFLKEKGTIGITAVSAGLGYDQNQYDNTLNNLKGLGFNIVETKNVKSKKEVSSSAKSRAKQLDDLVKDELVDVIMCAGGGDYLMEMLPYVKWDSFVRNPKWICGYSDPTSILFTLTTKYDIATIYGYNAGGFCSNKLAKYQLTTLDYLKGNIVKQKSYSKYEDFMTFDKFNPKFVNKVEWKSTQNCKFTGRLIGGCIDCLKTICGMEYDKTSEFVEKYKDDGIIWAFDNFALSSAEFYTTLWKMKEMGWFKYTKGVIVGRVLFPKIETGVDYDKALEKIFGKDIPIVTEACIGHVTPCMTLVLGAIATIEYKDGKGSIGFELR